MAQPAPHRRQPADPFALIGCRCREASQPLLPQLIERFSPLRRWEAVELEPALAEAFQDAGVPQVEGSQ